MSLSVFQGLSHAFVGLPGYFPRIYVFSASSVSLADSELASGREGDLEPAVNDDLDDILPYTGELTVRVVSALDPDARDTWWSTIALSSSVQSRVLRSGRLLAPSALRRGGSGLGLYRNKDH